MIDPGRDMILVEGGKDMGLEYPPVYPSWNALYDTIEKYANMER